MNSRRRNKPDHPGQQRHKQHDRPTVPASSSYEWRSRLREGFCRLWAVLTLSKYEPESRFAGWVARLTLVLCLVGTFQAWAFIESERASLAPDAFMFSPAPAPGKPTGFVLKVKNGGRSTAWIIDSSMQAVGNLAAEPNYRVVQGGTIAVIVPDQTSQFTFREHKADGVTPIIWTQPDIDKVQHGNVRIILYGFIKYRDDYSFLFGSRRLGFCFQYESGDTPDFASCADRRYVYPD